MDERSQALLELGRKLSEAGYAFVTPTPETHRRVIARRTCARDLRDVFGWSLPFQQDVVPAPMRELLVRAGALENDGESARSRVRFSTLDHRLYVHSAYPTQDADSVFFGPDTYRFCAFVGRHETRAPRVIDIGCGTGAGGLVAARAANARELVLCDVNPRALAYAEVNLALADHPPRTRLVRSDVLNEVEGTFDLIVANPPFMRDSGQRTYRDGGGQLGEALSVRIVRESLSRLAPAGTLLLYTGAAILGGEDLFLRSVRGLLDDWVYHYEELDPDVFGEELEQPGYESVERIAAVGLSVRRPV